MTNNTHLSVLYTRISNKIRSVEFKQHACGTKFASHKIEMYNCFKRTKKSQLTSDEKPILKIRECACRLVDKTLLKYETPLPQSIYS